jgi:peptidase E
MFSDLILKVGTEVFFTQKINNFLAKLDVVIAKAGMARKDRSQINELLQG